MSQSARRRFLLLYCAVLASASACSNILGIDPPKARALCQAAAGCAGDTQCAADDCTTPGGGGALAEGGALSVTSTSTSGAANGGAANGGAANGGAANGGAAGVDPAGGVSGGVDQAGSAGEPAAGSPGCVNGQKRCQINGATYVAQTCRDGSFDAGTDCKGFCSAGKCESATSCETAKPCVGQASCCEPVWIEGDKSYEMGWGNSDNSPTTKRYVSGFYLGRFEVTVGRFQEFVNDYESSGVPKPGAGAHPRIANSGWQAEWEQEPDPYNPVDPNDPDGPKKLAVPRLREELVAQLSRSSDCTWPSTKDLTTSDLPITCVNWFVAFQFCAWDHGRLPTEAEWNFAAAHGADRLHYPWSADPTDLTIGESRAWYDTTKAHSVGTKDGGHGRFARYGGLEDLSGNVQEWVLDRFLVVVPLDPYHDVPCVDCFERWNLPNDERVVRGGEFDDPGAALLTGFRRSQEPATIDYATGFRCAYDLIKE